jgi:Rieske Fe-S protein
MDRILRRKFVKSILAAVIFPVGWLLNKAVEKHRQISSGNKKVVIEDKISNGITFYENLIIIKDNDSIKIFSSSCSHLGCKINKVHGSELVCPCHGSRYDLTGKAVKGPAQKSLKFLRFKREEDKIIIYES